jgi:polyphosphate kinase
MPEKNSEHPLMDRELSWLSFSHRVLQEAQDPEVPLFERLFFCGIFSSNLDEFFRVRVASLRSLLRLGKPDHGKLGLNPHLLLHEIHETVVAQQEEYGKTLGGLITELGKQGIDLVDDSQVGEEHVAWLREYFATEVREHLSPSPLEGDGEGPPFLKNHCIYLVVELWPKDPSELTAWRPSYSLVEVPCPPLARFVTLPGSTVSVRVMFLDDVIRFNLGELFPDHRVGGAYAVKLSRDADLHVEDEFDGDLVEAIRKSLSHRATGVPSRFLYDMRAPYVLIHTLQHRLGLADEDLVVGARYHNLSDYMGFPRFDRSDLGFPDWPELPHPELDAGSSVIGLTAERDRVIHTPYQSFSHMVRFLEEAADDRDVEELWLTVYRVARDSAVLNALVRAARAGKRVTVFMEVQARFDEESNLEWADRLEEAGANTLYSMPGLKVHAKLALIARREGTARRLYAYVGTGNFNEKTARIYTDHGVFTADERVTQDVEQVFHFLEGRIEEPLVRHLFVAPKTLRRGFNRLIDGEIEAAKKGEPCGMTLKMNALQDAKIIERLYKASQAGVPIKMMVRGICRLVPGVPGLSDTIEIRSILDRYLEHARIYQFHAGGEERLYIASADWMSRNLKRRVEVAMPVYDARVKAQLQKLLEIQWADNSKARFINEAQDNSYVPRDDSQRVRAQEAFRDYVASLAGELL